MNMTNTLNITIGVGIIILNIIPFLIRKPKYLFITIMVSLLMLLLLLYFKQ